MNLNGFKKHTQARILLSRSGASIGTKDWLSFSYAHASARDAIFNSWDQSTLTTNLNQITTKNKNTCYKY
ncbi:MAG: ethanolamine ammonia-lyase light chain EutC [Bacteriovoracaceae bacterium]